MSQDQPRSSESIHPESPQSELPESSESSETLSDSASASSQTEPLAESAQPLARANTSRAVPISPRSTPTRRTPPENDEILPQTLLRLVGEAFVAAQPPLKQQSLRALRGTIHFLETAVERLEAEPAPKRKAPVPDTAPESVLPPHSKPHTGKLAPTFSTDALREKFQTVWRQLWRSWRSILRHLRDRLPASIHRNFSDQALTAAIAGMIAIVLWATSARSPDQPQTTTIAKAPSVVNVTPSPEAAPTPTTMPPIVQAPEAPPVEISPTPTKPPLPAPPLKLTPEQTLIARIQDQVAAISNQYVSGLVQSTQANFRGSRLIVHISDGWYGLSRSQQDKLAGEILRGTQALDFIKLEMVDGAGTLLARSPIVGGEMIILKRTNILEQAG